MFGGRVAKHRRTATEALRASEACAKAGRVHEALAQSRSAEESVRWLIEREPKDPFHRFVLAGLMYNRATILDALGDGPAALSTGREAYELYSEFDPSHGDPSAVPSLLRDFRADSDEIERVIAQAADARARYARLLAKYGDRAEAAIVHRHGSAAVHTYEALVRGGHHYLPSDLARVRTQYDEAKAHLGKTGR